jgi:ankyrin repeat domain-containing protein 50
MVSWHTYVIVTPYLHFTLLTDQSEGAGKTVLRYIYPPLIVYTPDMLTSYSSIAIDYLKKNFDSKAVGVGYIFCNYKEQERQTAKVLIASLLKQLIQDLTEYPAEIPTVVSESYKSHKKLETEADFAECLKLLHTVVSLFPKVFIVIDALDECIDSGGTKRSIIKAITDLPTSNVQILITSRKTPDIETMLRGWPKVEIKAHDQDIQKYLDHHIDDELLGVVEEYPSLREEIITTIREGSKNM